MYEYTTSFDAGFKPETLFLAFPESAGFHVGDGLRMFVNDTEVPATGSWVTDISLKTFDVSALVKKGANSVRMVVEREGWTGEPVQSPARAKLMGSFSLAALRQAQDDRSVLQPPVKYIRNGSWTDQGYPYYSGTAAYRQTIFVPEFARGQRIILRADAPADAVEFVINGRVAGLRPWAPFEVDITALVTAGPNTIELRVTNSLANMMASEPRPSGLIGGATAFLA